MGDHLIKTRQLAEGPDAVIGLFVTPAKPTQGSQAVHLEDFKAIYVTLQSWPRLTAIQQHRQHNALENQHLPGKCQILAGPHMSPQTMPSSTSIGNPVTDL